jgi:hypothetical protein
MGLAIERGAIFLQSRAGSFRQRRSVSNWDSFWFGFEGFDIPGETLHTKSIKIRMGCTDPTTTGAKNVLKIETYSSRVFLRDGTACACGNHHQQ